MKFRLFQIVVAMTISLGWGECVWGPSSYAISTNPTMQQSTNQQINLIFSMVCPESTNSYSKFLGAVVSWGDGSSDTQYDFAKKEFDYKACVASGNVACFSNPASASNLQYENPTRSLSLYHTYSDISSHTITVTPWLFASGTSGTTYSWDRSHSANVTVIAPPIGYCGIPNGYAVFGINQLTMNDWTKCSETISGSNLCRTGSTVAASYGVAAKVDQVDAPSVILRNNSIIVSGVWANIVSPQLGATYTKKGAYVATSRIIKKNIVSNTSMLSKTVESGNSTTLYPGKYNNITVRDKGTISLSGSGQYFMNDMSFDYGSILKIAPGSTAIEVYTNSLTFRGTVVNSNPELFLVGVLGTGTSFVETGFIGSIWVPDGSLVLGQSSSHVYSGSYYANEVTIHQTSTVKYVQFISNRGCN